MRVHLTSTTSLAKLFLLCLFALFFLNLILLFSKHLFSSLNISLEHFVLLKKLFDTDLCSFNIEFLNTQLSLSFLLGIFKVFLDELGVQIVHHRLFGRILEMSVD